MKIIKVNDYEIDIVEENEIYINIYTFLELCHSDLAYLEYGSWEPIDEGKGWKLSKLNRVNRITKQTFDVEFM